MIALLYSRAAARLGIAIALLAAWVALSGLPGDLRGVGLTLALLDVGVVALAIFVIVAFCLRLAEDE